MMSVPGSSERAHTWNGVGRTLWYVIPFVDVCIHRNVRDS